MDDLPQSSYISPELYKSEIWTNEPYLAMDFKVANKTEYTVKCHFVENYFDASKVGKRVFNIEVDGVVVADSIDVLAITKKRNAVLIKTFDRAAGPSRNLRVVLSSVVGQPMINAIEVFPKGQGRGGSNPGKPQLQALPLAGPPVVMENIAITAYGLVDL